MQRERSVPAAEPAHEGVSGLPANPFVSPRAALTPVPFPKRNSCMCTLAGSSTPTVFNAFDTLLGPTSPTAKQRFVIHLAFPSHGGASGQANVRRACAHA